MPAFYGRLLGHDLIIQPASEPTDIIWENRFIKPKWRRNCKIMVYLIIVIMLAFSGAIIYFCSSTSTSLKLRYPRTDCKANTAQYIGDKALFTPEDWQVHAFKEFEINEALKKKRMATQYTATMQCFCRHQGPEKRN